MRVGSPWRPIRRTINLADRPAGPRLGLPTAAKELAALIPDDRLAVTAAALVRVALDKDLAEQVRQKS